MSAGRPHVGLLGSRGIPARYGGYETFFEQLAPRLIARGFEVTVYCRSRYTPRSLREHRGARLVVLPTLPTKHFDTPVHTLLSVLDAPRRRLDVALMVNGVNAFFVPALRLAGVRTALHVDGIEAQRAKWGWFGRSIYRLSERVAGRVANILITDAEVIRRHYLERHNAASEMIPYGFDPQPPRGSDVLEQLGLAPGEYFLYVSRFEPENNPHVVAEAYRSVPGERPLVMLGSAPYADRYIAEIKARADPRVLFPGALYGDGYRQLQANAFAYVHATEVGGTHPALVEAMGYANCVLVNDTPENREVAAGTALYFDCQRPETLSDLMRSLVEQPEKVAAWGEAARERACEHYSWEAVADAYATVLRRLLHRRDDNPLE